MNLVTYLQAYGLIVLKLGPVGELLKAVQHKCQHTINMH
jgi:hypothetical protein